MSTLEARLSPWAPQVLSILRIMSGLLFLEHGTMKAFGFPAPMAGFTWMSLLGAAAIIEGVGGLLVTLGLFTRIAAFIMSGEMAFAYFMVHTHKSFFPALNSGDAAVLYCFVFLYFVFSGPGPWSLDAARRK